VGRGSAAEFNRLCNGRGRSDFLRKRSELWPLDLQIVGVPRADVDAVVPGIEVDDVSSPKARSVGPAGTAARREGRSMETEIAPRRRPTVHGFGGVRTSAPSAKCQRQPAGIAGLVLVRGVNEAILSR